jgi:hypothetical protein
MQRLKEHLYLSLATKNDFRGYIAARLRLKKIKHTYCLVSLMLKCLFAIEKDPQMHLNDLRRRLTS